MKESYKVDLTSMNPEDIEAAVALVSSSMNDDEANWAKGTFDFYFACKQFGANSGREYNVCKDGDQIIGLVGLHHYMWGPSENVWLSWFAVLPSYQGKGIGKGMLETVEQKAREKGFRKFFVETYDGPTFDRAREFYQSMGFTECGQIKDYLSDNKSMRIFKKNI